MVKHCMKYNLVPKSQLCHIFSTFYYQNYESVKYELFGAIVSARKCSCTNHIVHGWDIVWVAYRHHIVVTVLFLFNVLHSLGPQPMPIHFCKPTIDKDNVNIFLPETRLTVRLSVSIFNPCLCESIVLIISRSEGGVCSDYGCHGLPPGQ